MSLYKAHLDLIFIRQHHWYINSLLSQLLEFCQVNLLKGLYSMLKTSWTTQQLSHAKNSPRFYLNVCWHVKLISFSPWEWEPSDGFWIRRLLTVFGLMLSYLRAVLSAGKHQVKDVISKYTWLKTPCENRNDLNEPCSWLGTQQWNIQWEL